MPKISLQRVSYSLNVVLLLILLITWSTSEEDVPLDLSIYTQQDLSKAIDVSEGMAPEAVSKIMGRPIKKELAFGSETWHYCATGSRIDEYVAVRFAEGVVVQIQPYVVSYLDVVFKHTESPSDALVEASGLGDCRLTVGMGNYGSSS